MKYATYEVNEVEFGFRGFFIALSEKEALEKAVEFFRRIEGKYVKISDCYAEKIEE
ncbi:MAG: hypothetical protein II306_07725 [Clostridia bacterium]|nr:hypothetical protein [Clostridia bacterium]